MAAPLTRAVQRPRCGAAPVLGHATEATLRLRPCPVIGRDDGAPREAPGPRPKLVVPTTSAAMKAVEEQADQGLAEVGVQERGKGPTSGWQGWAAEGRSAQGTGQSSAETE